jgi:hypothetical protein
MGVCLPLLLLTAASAAAAAAAAAAVQAWAQQHLLVQQLDAEVQAKVLSCSEPLTS